MSTTKPRTGAGISRPSAQHLCLPLVERDSSSYMALLLSAGQESNLLAVPSSHWTLTAGPKSSASMYSQESYTNSPPAFSESRVDRRRFGVALSPSQDGPWRQVVQHVPNTPVFILDLPSGEADEKELVKKDDQVSVASGGSDGEGVLGDESVGNRIQTRRKTTGALGLKRMYTTAHFQASRSTKVFGKMLHRISTPPPPQTQHMAAEDSSIPDLPELPPQILISLPSPGLDLNHDLPDVDTINAPPPKRLALLVDPTPRNRSTLPSTWKPKRPPSPLPQSARKKHGRAKHKRSTLDSPFIPHSPLPPLPPLVIPTSPVSPEPPESSYTDTVGFSPSHFLHPAAGAALQSGWDDPGMGEFSVKMYLRARAMKTATYAIHDGGIISPP